MIIKSAEFVKSATAPAHYPSEPYPEIAFAGRSNVGKSSLINTLVNRKQLVKTSSTPGRTQLINFFLINGAFSFVDLPGYGYAKVPKAVTQKWGPMIETFLKTRDQLLGVVLLMDMRRTPDHKEIDFIRWMTQYHLKPVFVLTKADKLPKTKQASQLRNIADILALTRDELIPFSTKTRMGKDRVWSAVDDILHVTP
jgi:GTP-binding protein